MTRSQEFLTTQEFAQKAGVSTSTVSKWIRTDKINGRKESGKWMVPAAELSKVTTSASSPSRKESPAAPAKSSKPIKNAQFYTVAEFSAMTYLTEFGVALWLKQGRLNGAVDPNGAPVVDPSSLELPDVKRLLR